MDQTSYKFPTEVIELPSKGLLYPTTSVLSSGRVEIKYPTAKQEDILTNINYVRSGIVLDKLIQSLLVTKINYDELLAVDKNALLLAIRILGFGAEYVFFSKELESNVSVDLTTLKEKEIDWSKIEKGKNEFLFTLPKTGNVISFKLLNYKDEREIEAEIKGLRKINDTPSDISTSFKFMITSINGNSEKKEIRDFIDNGFIIQDIKAFRKHIKEVSPGILFRALASRVDKNGVKIDDNQEEVDVHITGDFFWPND